MTKETNLPDTTRFISLDKSSEEWTEQIFKDYKIFKRRNDTKEMTDKNFNIEKEAGKLENKYFELNQ